MFKRVLVGGMLAVVVVGLALLWLLGKRSDKEYANIGDAVPPGAILFVDNIDYSYLNDDFRMASNLWSDLVSDEVAGLNDSSLNTFNTYLERMPELKTLMESGELAFSVHLMGKDELTLLFYVSLEDPLGENEIRNDLKGAFSDDLIFNEREYEAVSINDLSFGSDLSIDRLFYCIKDGVLIISTHSILLEESIRTMNAGSGIYNNNSFKSVSATAGKYVHANVYVNFSRINELFLPFVNSTGRERINILSDFSQWGEFDVDLSDDILVLSGMTASGDSISDWLNLFQEQNPVKTDIISAIPSNAYYFMTAGISDVDKFKDYFMKEMELRGLRNSFLSKDEAFQKQFGVSPFSDLLSLIDDELALFSLEEQITGKNDNILLLEVRSKTEAMQHLVLWLNVFAAEHDKEVKDYITEYQLDDQSKYNIYHLPLDLYSDFLPGNYIGNYFAFYDKYIIFSNSTEAISRTIYQNVLRKTIDHVHEYDVISNLMSTRANLTYFIKPGHYLSAKKHLINTETVRELENMEATIMKIPGLVLQFSNEGSLFYSSLSCRYTGQIREKALTVWESLLDSSAIIKPALVTNHYTSEKEILVQDAGNTLYLINSTGRILWKLRLDGPVLSEIFQVDFYKNSKLQYLFNTASGIHLIDRNGNYVERYPVKFRADATNPMVLFDYDNRKDYRIFIACENRKIYVYDLEGNIVPGWTFKNTEAKVTKPIQHFRVKEKDYIVFTDPIRTYILDRRGNERVKLKEMPVISKNNGFFLDMNINGHNPRFVSTDSSGNILAIDLEGKVEILLDHFAEKDHFFQFTDIDHDGVAEYIFSEKDVLQVLRKDGEKEFTFKIRGEIQSLPDIYTFSSSDLKIGITDLQKNEIYLVNSDGSLYEGFPLEGNTRFSIGYFAGSDSRFNLIVGSENGFLYNYSIQ